MTQNKKDFQIFVEDNYVPIFYKPWYLDVVCDGSWGVVSHEEEGEILGILVYHLKKKFGLKYILHPLLCPYMGPLFYGSQDIHAVYQALIAKLPSHDLRIQDYTHLIPKLSAVSSLSAKKYTYIFDRDRDVDQIWTSLSSRQRQRIKKAAEHFLYLEEDNISVLVDFLNRTFTSRGKPNPYAKSDLVKLDGVLRKRNARAIVKCIDPEGKIMAMGYFLKDEKWVYNMVTGVDTTYPHSAMALLLWNAIKDTLIKGRSFDFEGSSIPGVASFYNSFKPEKVHHQSAYWSKNVLIDCLVKIKNPELIRS